MICPNCGSERSYVINVRVINGTDKRRTRECKSCGEHWTTLEVPMDSGRVKVITLCEECKLHEMCLVESTLRKAGAKHPYCSEGKRREENA